GKKIPCFRSQRHMDTQDIRFLLDPFEGDLLCQSSSKAGFVFVISQNFHIKPLKLFGKCLSHITKTNYSQGFSSQLFPSVLFPVPNSSPTLLICLGKVVEKGQKHTNGMFCYCIPVSLRSIQNRNIPCLQILKVYLIQTRPCPSDKL